MKKKLKKLQAGCEGNLREGFLASRQIPRDYWERMLQIDIQMAKTIPSTL